MLEMARRKKMVSLALEPELIERLDQWLTAQDMPPSKTTVFETLLRKFLDDQANGG